jgi:hypothetical protein
MLIGLPKKRPIFFLPDFAQTPTPSALELALSPRQKGDMKIKQRQPSEKHRYHGKDQILPFHNA